MNKNESKYFNTAIKMDEAFLSLIETIDFEYITVKEICNKANVNRSTFYLHYETIDDLLEECIQYLHQKFDTTFSAETKLLPDISSCSKEELILITPKYLKPYLSFIKDNLKLYKTDIKYPQLFKADKTYQRMYDHVFSPILERFLIPINERQFYMFFYIKGIQGIIEHWLQEDCITTIENIINIIETCIISQQSKL